MNGRGLPPMLAALLPALLAPGPGWGNSATSVEFLGFSSDARFAAWEEYGIQDGSGFPVCIITVLGLGDCRPAGRFETVLEDGCGDLETARTLCREEASGLLDSLSGEWIEGRLCVLHLPTDLSVPRDSARFHSWSPVPGYHEGDRTVILSTEAVHGTELEEYWSLVPELLSVFVRDNASGALRAIRRDTETDTGLEGRFGYGIEGIWALGDSAFAVSIQALALGFEGPDRMYEFAGWRD